MIIQRRSALFILTLALLIATSGAGYAQQQAGADPSVGTGMLFDDAAYERVPRGTTLMRGDYDDLPPRSLLKAFTPFAGDQGRTSMCVGSSTAYAARTIVEAVENGWSGRQAITDRTYSPAYVYNQLCDPDYDPTCSAGSNLTWALDLLENEGVTATSRFSANCDQFPTPEDELDAPAIRRWHSADL